MPPLPEIDPSKIASNPSTKHTSTPTPSLPTSFTTPSSSSSSSSSSSPSSGLSKQALLYMSLLSLQFGVQPLLTAKYIPSTTNKTQVVMITEAIKFFIAGAMMWMQNNDKQLFEILKTWSFKSWLFVAGLPAVLYTIQNMFALQAYQSLDSITFNVLNQTKTISAAVCCYLLIGKQQTFVQVVALAVLGVSVCVIEGFFDVNGLFKYLTSTSSNLSITSFIKTDSIDSTKLFNGIIPCLIASFISGFTGALSQMMLQGKEGKNSFLFSMELSAFSCFSLSFYYFIDRFYRSNEIAAVTTETALPIISIIPILTNALGGITVGLVTKHAGSVSKGFALIFGIILTGVVQGLLEDGGVDGNQVFGVVLVVLSMFLHSSFGEKASGKKSGRVEKGVKVQMGGKSIGEVGTKKAKKE